MQSRQQKGDVGTLLLAQFFIELQQRLDGLFAEGQKRLNQVVGNVVRVRGGSRR